MELTFREALHGYVAAAPEHAAGDAEGRRSGGRLGFRALARIEDIDRFEADPDHPIRLDGEVDYAPLGGSLPLRGGVLNVFVVRAGGRRMLYRLPFEAAGRRYVIVGEKRLPRPPTLANMTTLFTDLMEEGRSEPIARGILRVPPLEVLRFGLHVRVPGRGLLGSLGPALRFLLFSQRQLRAALPATS
jgi:cholesterol oxidase